MSSFFFGLALVAASVTAQRSAECESRLFDKNVCSTPSSGLSCPASSSAEALKCCGVGFRSECAARCVLAKDVDEFSNLDISPFCPDVEPLGPEEDEYDYAYGPGPDGDEEPDAPPPPPPVPTPPPSVRPTLPPVPSPPPPRPSPPPPVPSPPPVPAYGLNRSGQAARCAQVNNAEFEDLCGSGNGITCAPETLSFPDNQPITCCGLPLDSICLAACTFARVGDRVLSDVPLQFLCNAL